MKHVATPSAESPTPKARAIAEARTAVAAGEVIDHAEMVRWLASWGEACEQPSPEARG